MWFGTPSYWSGARREMRPSRVRCVRDTGRGVVAGGCRWGDQRARSRCAGAKEGFWNSHENATTNCFHAAG